MVVKYVNIYIYIYTYKMMQSIVAMGLSSVSARFKNEGVLPICRAHHISHLMIMGSMGPSLYML